ncbi:MAG TPA: carbamoyltransferase HypF [Clostridia bacterium]|nr:carbamoyltransferase HypF [Clostridia bacterium]
MLRLKVVIRGAVQGVGFRPFIYRLATEMRLPGWVSNTSEGVFIEVEGARETLQQFLFRIEREKPAISYIQSLDSSFADPLGFTSFEIKESMKGAKTAIVLPDIATCPDCLREVNNERDRRYRYPFTNCTNCGPRFTIIESLPYDRPATTMRKFKMCAECEAEYKDPLDRRFHAQPNACPKCGPHLELWSASGEVLGVHDDALRAAAVTIREGRIVAVKGLGGFHLLVDARNESAVWELRGRKQREEKPFAVMYPTLESVKAACEVNELEKRLLRSPESPIVLLQRKPNGDGLADGIAPGNPYLGVMLPYTPLHHLLMSELGFPVVATSGNLSDEPICTDEHEALRRLSGIADFFLVHNRPILRHVDDSIARIVLDRELVQRRARGFAPLPVKLDEDAPAILAVGAHQKNTVASSVGQQVFVSQHIGDLETTQAYEAFGRVITSFEKLYEFTPQAVACDLHPNYLSTRYARGADARVIGVQHHYAHVLACMAENNVAAPVLGVSWDGSGYGPDGTVWGGEFLAIHNLGYKRAAHLRTFRLPGSEKAVKEPRRTALGLLYEMFGESAFERDDLPPVRALSSEEKKVLRSMLARGVNSPLTSSAGRLFDAVASLLDLRQTVRFEGQGATELEFRATEADESDEHYLVRLQGADPIVVDWAPMVLSILSDIESGVSKSVIARKFHNTMVEVMVLVAQKVGMECVALSGGCFQNKLLTERAVTRLQQAGFRVYWHQRIPPNDGGIAVGQVMAAIRELKNGEKE